MNFTEPGEVRRKDGAVSGPDLKSHKKFGPSFVGTSDQLTAGVCS